MSRKPDEWMPLHIGDYHADTTHLTRDQHGAYLLLLMAYWRRGAALPAEDGRLAAIAKASPAEWRKLRPVMAEFFTELDGCWHQKRADTELAKAKRMTDAKAEAGKKGAEKRWQQDNRCDGTAMAQPSNSHKQTDAPLPSPQPEQEEDSSLRSEGASPKLLDVTPSQPVATKQKPEKNQGTRWPPEGRVPFEWHEDAQAASHDSGLDPPDLRLEAGKFERYWASKPGAAGRKVDWRKTFINWIIKAAEDAASRSKTGRKPTSTDTHLSVLAEIFGAEDGRSQGVPKHGQLALPAAKAR